MLAAASTGANKRAFGIRQWPDLQHLPSIHVKVRQRRIFADKSSIGSKNPAHELTNNWTTRRERSFRALCARPRPATDQSCPSDCRNSSRSDVGQRSGAYHRGRTQHLDVATRFRPGRLKSFSCSFGAHATVVASQSAGTLHTIGQARQSTRSQAA